MNIPYTFKKCSKCGKWLVANTYNFGKGKSYKWGLKRQCKKCEKQWREENKEHKKEYDKKYNKENKEHRKEHGKQWREENKEHKKEYDKKYNKENKEHRKEYNKKWREENKEYNKKYHKEYDKKWREENKEHRKEYNKQWREENPEKCFNSQNKRRSKEKNQGRGIDKIQWKEMFNFFQWNCAYSGEYIGGDNKDKKRTIDHILALDNGGLNEIWNCIPMVKLYNCSKNKRVDVMNWYLEQEYFSEDRLNKIVEWQIYAYEKWGGEEFGELILITDLIEK